MTPNHPKEQQQNELQKKGLRDARDTWTWETLGTLRSVKL